LYLAESSSRRCGLSTTLSHISLRMSWALALRSLDSTTADASEDGPALGDQGTSHTRTNRLEVWAAKDGSETTEDDVQ